MRKKAKFKYLMNEVKGLSYLVPVVKELRKIIKLIEFKSSMNEVNMIIKGISKLLPIKQKALCSIVV